MNEEEVAFASETETEPIRPYWLPAGIDFDSLPNEIKVSISGLINPAYRELVLQAEQPGASDRHFDCLPDVVGDFGPDPVRRRINQRRPGSRHAKTTRSADS
jgi:hypothetical protein